MSVNAFVKDNDKRDEKKAKVLVEMEFNSLKTN
jgi:hypothetical protein